MKRRVLASAVLGLIVAACSGDTSVTAPRAPIAPIAANAIGTDPMTGATIETNKDDYVPGEVVHLVGRGWTPNELVHLVMSEEPDTHSNVSMDVQADSTGGFSLHFYDVQLHDLGVTFTLTATGQVSGSVAVATFTDGNVSLSSTAPVANVVSWALTLGPSCTSTVFTIANSLNINAANDDSCIEIRAPSSVVVGSDTYDFTAWGVTLLSGGGPLDHTTGVTGSEQWLRFVAPNPGTTGSVVATYIRQASNAAPVLSAIGDQIVDEMTELAFTATATDENVATLVYSLANPASGDFPTGASITAGGDFTWTPTEAQGPGVYRVKIVVTDNGTLTDEEEIQITVNEVNIAPVLAAVGDQAVDELVQLAFTATATDADLPVNALTFSLDNPAAGTFPTGASITAGGSFSWTPTEAQGPGIYRVKVVVSDGLDADFEEIQITVNEVNLAPKLGAIGNKTVSEGTELAFTAIATDDDEPANSLTFSLGAGAPAGASIHATTGAFTWTPPDGPASVSITIIVTDDGTPQLNDSETITVTVNNVPPAISAVALSPVVAGNIYPITQAVTVTATFGDPGTLDTHTCSSVAIALNVAPVNAGPAAASGTTCANALSFLEAGVYDVAITVTDKDNGSDFRTVQVIIYDPSAGFVTGGGWIDSPAGAYYEIPSLTGKATFGFVSKYVKNSPTVPIGNTQFVFHAAGFNFHSGTYEFLIVNQNGTNAQFKGTGTMNGLGGYSFMLWATDGSPDKFRIKIWETTTNNPVYDNLLGGADGQVQAIAGGSIVIHTPKK